MPRPFIENHLDALCLRIAISRDFPASEMATRASRRHFSARIHPSCSEFDTGKIPNLVPHTSAAYAGFVIFFTNTCRSRAARNFNLKQGNQIRDMKHIVIRSLQTLALLFALAVPAFAEESNRGLFEGDLSGGGKVVAFVQGNHALSIYVFDTSGHAASFAAGGVGDDGRFSIRSSNGSTLSGTLSSNTVTVSLNGTSVTLNRTATFGKNSAMAGRFNGSATSSSNGTLDVRLVLDSQGNIFFIGRNGQSVTGGFGTIAVQQTPCGASPTPTPSPSATASPSATPTPSATASPTATPTATPTPGMRAEREGEDDDDEHDEDRDEDHSEFCQQFTGTFTITGMNGETITGSLILGHGVISGRITINGVTFTFNANEESAFNRLANISTRGFVNTGQGQLIGGFIIRGGPKLVLIRALGPSLTSLGVSPVLANPKLQLFQKGASTPLRENDDWQSSSNASDISKSGIAPSDSKEAAILVRLEPGAYTTVVSGADGGTGIALVEIYEIDAD